MPSLWPWLVPHCVESLRTSFGLKDEELDELWVKYYRASAGLIWRKVPAVK